MVKEEQSGIGNCPHCTRIIFKDAVFNSEASFSTRCPHCNKAVRVIIKHKIEIALIAVQDDRKPKKIGTGTGLVVLILVLYLPPIMYRLVGNLDDFVGLLT